MTLTTAYLGLGSNLGDRLASMRAAVAALSHHPEIHIDPVHDVASLYETTPIGPLKQLPDGHDTDVFGRKNPAEGGRATLFQQAAVGGPPGQPMFLNSAVGVHTRLKPLDLLEIALAIEKSLGRVRREPQEARVIDLDLLLYDDLMMTDTQLTLPHPRLHERRFVLEPLAEIAGDVLHPALRRTVADLARQRRRESLPGEIVARVVGPEWLFDAVEGCPVTDRPTP